MALAAVAAYVLAAFPGRTDGRRQPTALVVGVVLHAVLLVLDISGLGSDSGGARLGFGPVVSLTVWLVLAVHTAESRLVPQPGVRRVLALLGAARWFWPGRCPESGSCRPVRRGRLCTGCSESAPMVCSARQCFMPTMLDSAETRMRQHAGGPQRAFGMPLLQLERLTFRFVEAGFVVLSAALVLGTLTSPQWRWNHKTVFSLLGWAVIGALLAGRKLQGWRGRRATRWLYAGAALLLLAYAGSRFVMQFVLGRPVD